MNGYQPSYIRGRLPSSGCGPKRQDQVCLQVATSAIPRHLGNGLDHVLYPRQRFHGVLQVERFEIPHCLYVLFFVGFIWLAPD